MRRFILLLLLLGGMTAAHAADSDPLMLSAAQIRIGGIASVALRPVQRAATVTGYGQVLDSGRLAVASAQLASARAGVAQARARLALARAQESRAARLFRAQHNISQARYQTAQAAAQVAAAGLDIAQARLRAARAQLLAEWGPALARNLAGTTAHATASAGTTEPVSAPSRAAKSVAEPADAMCLVQVTLPLGAALATPPRQAEGTPAAGRGLALTLVGPSPRTPAGSGPSYYYRGSAAACPPAGTTVETRLPDGPARTGVLVPATAVVWRGGVPLAFRDDGARGFAPVSLAGAIPFADGYFLPAKTGSRLRPGQKIVVRGAALLLSQATLDAQAKPKGGGDDDD